MTVYKFNISKLFTKITLVLFFVLSFITAPTVFAQKDKNIKKNINSKTLTPLVKNSLQNPINVQDTIKGLKTDSLQIKKDTLPQSTLTSQLYHYAEDYTEVNEAKKFIKLYNKAHIKYKDIDITAGVIYVDYAKKEVYAGRIPDSLGKMSQRPIFKQGRTETENDSIRFNFETKKALVWNTYTKEGEFGMHSALTKKYNDSVIFVKDIKFTTSTDKEHPEYYFLAKKAKIVPGKKIVIGPTQMWIEDVATPLFIPFGFFPLTETRTSGFLMPTFADTRYGYSLNNGGFYWAINPHMDLQATGDIYTNGSYGFHLKSRYLKRYKYRGDVTFNYLNQITAELPVYKKKNEWKIIWNQHQDSKSNPLSNFSAHVDLGSSKYYRDSYNYNDITNTKNRLNNTLASSVSYQKSFAELPINYTLSFSHRQNVNTETINLMLPQFNLNVSRIYPFSKNGQKKNALQRLALTYRLESQHSLTTTDSLFLKKEMWDGSKLGAKQTIPISTNMKIFKYINFQPQVNYTEVWVGQSIRKYWDPNANNGNGREAVKEVKGFESFRNISASGSLSTSIYGTYLFNQKSLIQGIRHTISTSVNLSYTPIFDQFIKKYYDPNQDKNIEYTIFDSGLYGTPNRLESKRASLSFNNQFEAKVRTKDEKSKKIRFLNISTGYNFLADSLKIQKPRLSSTAQITQGLSVNMSATYDIYALNEDGKNFDALAISEGQGIGRIENFNISTGYNFSNKTFSKKSTEKKNKTTDQDLMYQNKVQWSLHLDYHLNYKNKKYSPDNLYFKEIGTHSITFSGKISFSPAWQFSYQSGYDLVNKGFTLTQLRFYRDLKSWKMSLTWNPLQPSYWFFNIGIKSSVLQGIKYDKRKEPFKKFF